jgi:hypothetical protein
MATPPGDDLTAVYTLHALTVDTPGVIAEIRMAGKPAFITTAGRFIAVIVPLEPGEVESRVLPELAREIRAALLGGSSNKEEGNDGRGSSVRQPGTGDN